MRNLVGAVLGLAALCATGSANAAIILDTASLNPTPGPSFTLGNFGPDQDQDPLGQTFMLNQSHNNLMIGGAVSDVNDFNAPSFEITISLVSGAGVGGPVLGSFTSTLADGFSGIHSEDFSGLGTLLAGTYTAVFSSGGTSRGALGITPAAGDPLSDPYSEDGLFTIFGDPDRDFAVRVTADLVNGAVSVPEPASLALFGLGLATLISLRRRKTT